MVYTSAISFCPLSTSLRKGYAQGLSGVSTVPIGLPTKWHALVDTFEGHTNSIWCVAYSPDGERIATASLDRTIRLWDVSTGAQLLLLEDKDGVLSVAFSPDGKGLLSGSRGGNLCLWDTETGVRIKSQQEAHSDWIRAVAYSYQGRYAASASSDKKVKLWNVETADLQLIATLSEHSDRVITVAFSHDEKFLLSGSSDKTCKIWNLPDEPHRVRTLEHDAKVRAVTISLDDKLVACGTGKEVVLWAGDNSSGFNSIKRLKMQGDVWALDFSPLGSSLAVGCDTRRGTSSSVCIMDCSSGELIGVREEIRGEGIGHLRFSTDGTSLVSSHDRTARVWDSALLQETTQVPSALQSLSTHGAICAVAFSLHDGNVIAVALEDGTVQLWNVSSAEPTLTIANPDATALHSDIVALTWSSDGSRFALTGRKDASIALYESQSKGTSKILRGHTSVVVQPVFSRDSQQLVSGSLDGTVRAFDVNTGSEKIIYRGKGEIWALATYRGGSDKILFSCLDEQSLPGFGDSEKVVTGYHPSSQKAESRRSQGYPTIRLCDLASGAITWQEKHAHGISVLSISADDSLVAAANCFGEVSVWTLNATPSLQVGSKAPEAHTPSENGDALHLVSQFNISHPSLVNRILFSPDNRAVITYNNYTPIPFTPEHNFSQTKPEDASLSKRKPNGSSSSLSNYFVGSDGWVWGTGPGGARRRVHWLPPIYRYASSVVGWETRGGWDIRGHMIALATNDGRLVVVDVSG